MENKIQTGLRIPEQLHKELQAKADKAGVSVNQLCLMLISLGMDLLDRGVIPRNE